MLAAQMLHHSHGPGFASLTIGNGSVVSARWRISNSVPEVGGQIIGGVKKNSERLRAGGEEEEEGRGISFEEKCGRRRDHGGGGQHRHVCCGAAGGGVVAMNGISSLRPAGKSGRLLRESSMVLAEQADALLDDNDVPVKCPSMLVFSGGTAFNGVVEELKKLTTRVAHVLPVSDDGGSTAEIVRVLGGPAVGDIRSRCLRLSSDSSAEAQAVKMLLGYRLSVEEVEAKSEWYEIVEGDHQLWDNVSGPYRETIRAFLVHFQSQILRHSKEKFSFRNGSIGNFFFAGARLFFQSLDAAIFLYSRVSHIPTHSLVLPVICTNDRLTLGCELHNGTVIRGQNAISHPLAKELAGKLPQAINKVMQASPPLPSPIKRIFYMSSEGTNLLHEVFPEVNPTVLEQLHQVDAVVYGIGSLYTSICPSLVLRGVGEAIAAHSYVKVLILNGTHDRETVGMSASAFVASISDALNRKFCDALEHKHSNDPRPSLNHPSSAYITVILVPAGGEIEVDVENLSRMGIRRVVTVNTMCDERLGRIYEPKALIEALRAEITIHHCQNSH